MSDDAFDDEVAAVTFDRDDESVVVIVGSGAGGGTLAHELCAKGIDVVLLEAGPRYRLTDFGLRATLSFTRAYARIVRDGLAQVLETESRPGSKLHVAFRRIEEAMDDCCGQLRLAA